MNKRIFIFPETFTESKLKEILKEILTKGSLSRGLIIFKAVNPTLMPLLDIMEDAGHGRCDRNLIRAQFEKAGSLKEKIEIGVPLVTNLFVFCPTEELVEVEAFVKENFSEALQPLPMGSLSPLV